MFFKKSEEELLNRIHFILKDCWHKNINETKSINKVKRYLNYRIIKKEEHKFLYEFRKRLNNINLYSYTSKNDIDKLFHDFYKYFYRTKKCVYIRYKS